MIGSKYYPLLLVSGKLKTTECIFGTMSSKKNIRPDQSISMLTPKDSHMTLNPEDSISSVGVNPRSQAPQQYHYQPQQQLQYPSSSPSHRRKGPSNRYSQMYGAQPRTAHPASYQQPSSFEQQPQQQHPNSYYGSQEYNGYPDIQLNPNPISDIPDNEAASSPFLQPESLPIDPRNERTSNTSSGLLRASALKSRPQSHIDETIQRPAHYFPFFSYGLSTLHVIVLIIALIMNKNLTGNILSPFTINPMIGPEPVVLIKEGARFVPCMKKQNFATFNTSCPTGPGSTNICGLDELCGFSPGNQWYRLILPIFIHAGIIHLLSNVFFQLTLLKDLEKIWGWFLMVPIIIISGSFSFLFGAAYSKNGSSTPSVGSSGALFGIIAAILINLLIHWKSLYKPVWQVINLAFVVVISILLGVFVPFIDNYAHIGGFIMGIGNGLIFAPYESVRKTLKRVGIQKSLIYSIWFPWACRFLGLAWTIVLYAVVLNDFYSDSSSCSFCGNLSK